MRIHKYISKPKKRIFSFVVDGECEVWYIQLLKQHEALSINLEPKLPQKKKMQDQFNLVSELAQESEKVFWVIDFDTVLKEARETKKGNKTLVKEFEELYNECKSNEKIIIIVNNPCLEYWFLQHFEQTTKYFATYGELEKSLKKHLFDYEKTVRYYKNSRQNIYQKLKPNQPIAIKNAKKTGNFDFTNIEVGMTEMYKIFEELELKNNK